MLSSHVVGGESRPEFPMLLPRERDRYDGRFFRNVLLSRALDPSHDTGALSCRPSFHLPVAHVPLPVLEQPVKKYNTLHTDGNAWFILALIIGTDNVLLCGHSMAEIPGIHDMENAQWIVINHAHQNDSAKAIRQYTLTHPDSYICVNAAAFDNDSDCLVNDSPHDSFVADYAVLSQNDTETVRVSARLINAYPTLEAFKVR